uniref:Uncharacterized protein n=1 Tax=Megaselia scalaris TaxID=36166 RepID=T1GV92_MEGSC
MSFVLLPFTLNPTELAAFPMARSLSMTSDGVLPMTSMSSAYASSDQICIEGEFVPRPGDEVKYRLCHIPPKMEKVQAIHCQIINLTPEVHHKWEDICPDDN